ncbi:MAG: M28 family peptidase [Bacteroidota bacterium]
MNFHARMLLLVCILMLPTRVRAQESPFVDDEIHTLLVNELSGDMAFDHLRWLVHYHRVGGSEDFHEAAEYVAAKAREYGLSDVQIVTQKSTGTSWTGISGEAWITEPVSVKLGSYAEIAVALATNSRDADIEAQLVAVGMGTKPSDYEGKDVSGKIVLASGSLSQVMRQAVWVRGAVGILSYHSSRSNPIDFPDQVAYSRIPHESSSGEPGTFAFMISLRKGRMLEKMIKKDSVVVRVTIDSEFRDPPMMEYVMAEIPGATIHDQDVVLTAHLQEEKTSANDDGSGCANILEIGRTIVRLIDEGKIPRPLRDIRFWWTTEISSEYRYFRDHPDERREMLANINQDMVGAKQSIGSRAQLASRTPYSLPCYLSDVFENIVDYVKAGNTSDLPVRQAGGTSPHPKPIYSHLGSREGYNARVVKYFDNTDHLVFNEAIIGIPGVDLTNWPDYYIHSSADDLWQVDQTQLKRNAFIVAATALYVASATDASIPTISAEVYSMALKRVAEDLNTALQHIANPSASAEEAYHESVNLIEQSFIRERGALRSIRVFSKQRRSAILSQLEKDLLSKRRDYVKEIENFYKAVTGRRSAPRLKLSTKERELREKIPENVGTVDEYFENRKKVGRVGGLHPVMRYEVYNFVDGKRSYLDIFNAVHAEAMSAGAYYYGTVNLGTVEHLLDMAVEKNVLRLK